MSWLSVEVARAMEGYAASGEDAIRSVVGVQLRGTVSVRLQRPRWMPDAIYRWLMRTIVVESLP